MANGRRTIGGRLLLCFGASALEEEEADRREASVRSRFSSAGLLWSEEEPESCRPRPHPRHRGAFRKIVRSAFFVASLDRARRTTLSEESSKSRPLISRSTDDDERRLDDRETVLSPSLSTSSSSSSSSSSTSLLSASSTEPPPKPKPKRLACETAERTKEPPAAPENYGLATAWLWLLVLVSLFVMVFCGRLGAILWTSTCLCLTPRRTREVGPPPAGGAAKAPTPRQKGWSELEKKRVVLEGLLERNKRA